MVFIETIHLISVLMSTGGSQSLELCNKSLIRDGQQLININKTNNHLSPEIIEHNKRSW
jgi:hypothetical protein